MYAILNFFLFYMMWNREVYIKCKICTNQFSHVCSCWVNDTAFSLWTCNIQTKSMYADQTVLYYQGNTLNKKWINQKRLNDLILYHLHLKIVVETLSANKHLDKSKQQTVVSNTLASFLSSLRETVCDILLNVCTWYIYIIKM